MNVVTIPAAGISGHITLRRWCEGGEAETRHFPNIITNRILASRIADFAPIVSIREALAYCRVGTGNTPPSVVNTALVAQIASTNTVVAGPDIFSSYDEDGRGYVSLVTTYQFAPGVATGVLQEVGFGSTAASNVLMSRALILDEFDIPTPLVVGAADYLEVTYELRLYTVKDPDDIILTGQVIDGDNYTITLRPIGAPALAELLTANPSADWTIFNTKEIRPLNILGLGNNWIGAFEAAEVMPAIEDLWELGTSFATLDANTVLQAYVPAALERSIDVTIPAGELNLPGGIGYLRLSTSEGSWGMEFTPPLAKVAGKVLTFTVLVQAIQQFTP